MHEIIFFPENLKKILGFTSKFRYGWVTINTVIFVFGLIKKKMYRHLSVKFHFVLANRADPDEMTHYEAIYLGLYTICQSTKF